MSRHRWRVRIAPRSEHRSRRHAAEGARRQIPGSGGRGRPRRVGRRGADHAPRARGSAPCHRPRSPAPATDGERHPESRNGRGAADARPRAAAAPRHRDPGAGAEGGADHRGRPRRRGPAGGGAPGGAGSARRRDRGVAVHRSGSGTDQGGPSRRRPGRRVAHGALLRSPHAARSTAGAGSARRGGEGRGPAFLAGRGGARPRLLERAPGRPDPRSDRAEHRLCNRLQGGPGGNRAGGARHEGADRVRLLTAAEQRELDRLAAEAGLPTRVLMESAGGAVAREVLAMRPARVIVFCGPGNNGGDGFVAARFLQESLEQVVVVATARATLKGDALAAAQAWSGPTVPVAEETRAGRSDVVVDAVCGSGLTRPPAGRQRSAIEHINEAGARGARVVCVDVPSGIDADTGSVFPSHIAKADRTITLHLPKRGLWLHPGAASAGEIRVAPIGTPRSLEGSLSSPACELLDDEWGRGALAPRRTTAHKNDFGHVLAVAGSEGKSGAATLIVLAALRAGAGLVTLAARPDVLKVALPSVPEAMGIALVGNGPLGSDDLGPLRTALKGKTALAIGPGIPRGPQTGQLIGDLLAGLDPGCAAVLDADALNALAEERESIAERLRRAPVRPVLPPHPGEVSRLTGAGVEGFESDRIEAAVRAASRFGACVILKGARTVVADPEGTSAVCAHGNPGMATAGAGDVLTGITAAILARRSGGGSTGDRARLAVLLHALAGDLAAGSKGEAALVASDIAQAGLPRLFRRWSR